MKRFHIHIGVENLEKSIEFYSTLFDSEPTKLKEDYAKWLLDDPNVNFAISTRVSGKGVDHLGIQVENAEELEDIRLRLGGANLTLFDEGEVVCCYSNSDKSWVEDPAGVAWETYMTMNDAKVYSASLSEEVADDADDTLLNGSDGCDTVTNAESAACCEPTH